MEVPPGLSGFHHVAGSVETEGPEKQGPCGPVEGRQWKQSLGRSRCSRLVRDMFGQELIRDPGSSLMFRDQSPDVP